MKAFLVLFILMRAAIAQTPGPSGPEANVRHADETWARAIAEKSVERALALYDAEAFTEGSAMPPARGLAQIRAMWTKLFTQPGFSLTWKVEKVVVTESGTLATSTGTWKMPNASGPYLAVWRKQSSGEWKVLVDSAWIAGKP